MPTSQMICLLKQAARADKQLLQAWTAVVTIISHGSTPGIDIRYEKYMEYLVLHSETLETSTVNNSKRKVNIADFMESYNQEDLYYNRATHLAAYMGEKGDIDEIQMVLKCNRSLRNRKP